MPVMLAFDVYGTLIDTHGVILKLEEFIGNQAPAFSQTWRDKQLEYSFRRGLMKKYETFAVCTAQALDYSCDYYKVSLDHTQKQALLNSYRVLPTFDDVADALLQLKNESYRLIAFSNGTTEAIETLLKNAKIRELFDDVVSVDEIQSFKPDPAVYLHLLHTTNATANESWLISSNPFDVLGANAIDMNVAWVQRSTAAVFDPWGIEPTVTINHLGELSKKIQSQ